MRHFFEFLFQLCCRGVARLMYARIEVLGRDKIPDTGSVLLCVNHANSLLDGVIVQAALSRTLRPVARKRLFALPFTGHILSLIKAVPVHSRAYGERGENRDGFERFYELMEEGELVVIFPEGHSHGMPGLFPLKTGAARMALGSLQRLGRAPLVIPAGITYSAQSKFRRSALLQFGEPIRIDQLPEGEDCQIAALTERLQQRMRELIVDADSWEELDFSMRLASFFELRSNKRSLYRRFTAMQILLQHQHRLHAQYPQRMRAIEDKLYEFDHLCKSYGVRDYQLDAHDRPWVLTRMFGLALLFLLVLVPLGVWGVLNNLLAYIGLRIGLRRLEIAQGQMDTARALGSLAMLSFFWLLQSCLVYHYHGTDLALLYALSLPVATSVVLLLRERRQRILRDINVFFLFLRQRDLRPYLLERRRELERELAALVKLAKLPVDFY